uniref:Uncharacterized protein n=1 Tax=viral metagenome TaxID=1070528 RepID=A0A6M3IKT8_9ZZZZ
MPKWPEDHEDALRRAVGAGCNLSELAEIFQGRGKDSIRAKVYSMGLNVIPPVPPIDTAALNFYLKAHEG